MREAARRAPIKPGHYSDFEQAIEDATILRVPFLQIVRAGTAGFDDSEKK